LLTPALFALLLFVVFCGRLADLRLRVDDATHQAVRAATMARSSGQASAEAQSIGRAALRQAGVTCRDLAVATQLGSLRPGQPITVTVTCHIGLSDLALLGIPGSTTATSTATAVVDRWRGEMGDE
jgi:hypothetical protein